MGNESSCKNFSDDAEILTFTGAILGFEDIKQYKLIFTEDDSPFFYLQAKEYVHPSFVVCDPISFVPDYNVDYNDETIAELKAESKDDLRCLVIATISKNIADITINLKSPIVLNIKNKLAKQYVTDVSRYSIRQKIFDKDGAAK